MRALPPKIPSFGPHWRGIGIAEHAGFDLQTPSLVRDLMRFACEMPGQPGTAVLNVTLKRPAAFQISQGDHFANTPIDRLPQSSAK